jgi:hypothetical protein
MKLPASLTPWTKHLQIFPDEISLTLGGYVQKISPFISPINSLDENSDGEPNGYDGVNRRGIYERLLLSELALADDFGDEFIRRAVMGEHLFLNLAKVSPSSKRVSIALFDAGAMQIGTPRIAHLAALIILARRAEAANTMFLWGVLQNEKQLIISDDTEASVKILLESRTPNDVSEEDFSAWQEKLKEVDKFADVWLIGSKNLSQFTESKGFSHLYVDETSELEKNELELKIKSASGIEKQILLELPPPNICTRLLRNPFEIAQPITARNEKIDGNVTNFFFDATGTKLFAKLDSESILSFPVQNINSVGTMSPTIYKPFDAKKYIAVGRLNKAIAVVSKIDNQTISLEYRKYGFNLPQGIYKIEDGKFAFPENTETLLQLFSISPRYSKQDKAAVLDAHGNLFSLDKKSVVEKDGIVGYCKLLSVNVLAAIRTDNVFIYVGCENGEVFHHIVSVSDQIKRTSPAANKIDKAIFGRGETGKKSLGLRDTEGNWTILEENDNLRIMPRPKGEVVGIYHDSRFAPNAGFFELMDDRKTIEFTWAYGRRRHILEADEEILKIEFNPRSPIFAYQTANELVIFSLTHKTAIGRYSK